MRHAVPLPSSTAALATAAGARPTDVPLAATAGGAPAHSTTRAAHRRTGTAAPLPSRPVVLPALRRLWRDEATLQLGRSAGCAAVLAGLDPAARRVLGLLDGSLRCDQLLLQAAALGCPPARTRELLALLGGAGLLVDADGDRTALGGLQREEREQRQVELDGLALLRRDGGAPALGHRRAARVQVLGAGRVGAPLAALLAVAGVGAVDVVDDGTTRPQDTGVGGLALEDVGQQRGRAVRARLRTGVPSLDLGTQSAPQLVLLTPARPEQLETARDQLRPGTAHLLAEVRDTLGVVGPLVLPGAGPCLHCLDLARSDRDPAWPALAAQLAGPSRTRQACDGPLALMVASQAAAQALALIDGTAPPAALGGTLELALPDWRWRRRSWPVHPDCGCGSGPRAAAGS